MAKKKKGSQATPRAEVAQDPADLAPADKSPSRSSPFPIVGIGASAGGLAALREFFSHVPQDSGLAYVVVVHLSPDHKSHLAELLQPAVKMPVQQVTDTVALEQNRVYVIPPNANLNTIDTHLRLSKLEEQRQQRAPIDHFFRTLAKTHDGEAIGVILTGTGSDGTLGLRDIKERGGLTVVQDPNEAEYDGMPQSAISTGMIDLVLPLAQIPLAVLRFVTTQPKLPKPEEHEDLDGGELQMLHRMFAHLRARTGRDFGRYKRSTILRPIQRRMQLRQIEEFPHYLELLRIDAEEVRILADDLLITVTSFFRDTEVFESLTREVIPRLFAGKNGDNEIRVWSVGCSTGEEAYSLAILLLEEAARHEVAPRMQVFASDLHEQSLKQAREGFFPGDIETDVSPERLKRFFQKENGGYRIRKDVREMVIFSPHNVLSDPPFSRIDMISCRNLMIYIQREVQRDIIDLFHYALKPDGFLVLGTSETVDAGDLFRVENKKHCIYQKRNVQGPDPRLPVFPLTRTGRFGEMDRPQRTGDPVHYGALHQLMVERYALPSALVSPDDKVVHLSEHTGRYLTLPGGEPTTSIVKIVREDLRIELRALLRAAREEQKPKRSKPIPVRFNGDTCPVVLHVRPSQEPQQEGYVLVFFDEYDPADLKNYPMVPSPGTGSPSEGKNAPGRIRELEAELSLLHQRLQSIIEEYETSQEEMKASNEEMQSTNEELRSTMEELETSKEELQSMNEELQTVNQENRHKVEELAQLSSDLQNLLAATDIATLFLDRDLRILRFTRRVGELFNVRVTDRGRPISDLTHNLGYDELQDDAHRVLEKLVPIEREVADDSGRWFLTRVMVYRSTEDRIEGVVITFVDITRRKQVEQEAIESKEYSESIVTTLHEPILVLNPDLTVSSSNRAFYEHFHVNPAETVGQKVYDLGNGQWNIPALRELLEDVLPSNSSFNDYEVQHDFEDLGPRTMLINGRRLEHMQLILLGIRDITERKRAEEALKEADRRKDEFLATLAHELRNPLTPICTALEVMRMAQDKSAAFGDVYDTLDRQTQQLVRLIDDLLDVSRITRGKLQLRKSVIRLSEVVQAAVEESQPLIDEAGQQLTVSIPKEPIYLEADPNRLAQVISNLLNNAARYTPYGGHIELSAARDNGELVLSVKDDGMGIPKEKQGSVFQIFSQVHLSTEKASSGLGIGLSLVKSLVEFHGGSIEVQSDGDGQGTEFRIRLPILTNPPKKIEMPAPPEEEETNHKERRVLVVDDNKTIRELSKRMIEMLGHTVQTASDGEEAVTRAEEFRPDIILMDLGMPKVDGCEAARRIRSEDWGKDILLVALSGWGQERDKARSEEAGFDHHLVKPAAPEDIKRLIGQCGSSEGEKGRGGEGEKGRFES